MPTGYAARQIIEGNMARKKTNNDWQRITITIPAATLAAADAARADSKQTRSAWVVAAITRALPCEVAKKYDCSCDENQACLPGVEPDLAAYTARLGGRVV